MRIIEGTKGKIGFSFSFPQKKKKEKELFVSVIYRFTCCDSSSITIFPTQLACTHIALRTWAMSVSMTSFVEVKKKKSSSTIWCDDESENQTLVRVSFVVISMTQRCSSWIIELAPLFSSLFLLKICFVWWSSLLVWSLSKVGCNFYRHMVISSRNFQFHHRRKSQLSFLISFLFFQSENCSLSRFFFFLFSNFRYTNNEWKCFYSDLEIARPLKINHRETKWYFIWFN